MYPERMSQDQESFRSEEDVLTAMRGVWGAQSMSAEDLEQFCPTAKVCKNVAELGIKGMDDENTASALRTEWKRMLEADGKVPENVQTIGELVATIVESQP